ncbi:alpha/beta hydrolase [Rubrivivax rivuli]|uniref:Acyl-CoA:diacylglycerol acyltransferase n=1 Tax=Rubrivivax rivuli TaxID=1862385 RepID=A0A437R8H5_9BURK|nr:alpha/beta hydrolase-fold protein [Rubrivivax rivuli]RVU43035.1 alpha/beta hydrolase [Rubrivivax rivuli]
MPKPMPLPLPTHWPASGPPNRRHALQALAVGAAWPLAACSLQGDPLPRLSAGRIERLSALASRHVDARHVDVWLPEGYDGRTRHPVLYMHDGQAVFDGASSMAKVGWRMDRSASTWAVQHRSPAPMVVAVWNHPTQRHLEYFPQPMLDRLPRAARERIWEKLPLTMRPFAGELVKEGRSRSEAYLKFLAEELKPLVDARFATRPGRDDTLVMGSSMGGLISVHALLSYPQVFGAAASLSTHWIGLLERNDDISDAALAWLRDALPRPADTLRLYLDRGTLDTDAQYAHAQGQVDALLRERGLAPPQVVSRVFEGAGHNERDWAARVHVPLEFLLRHTRNLGSVTPSRTAVT